jgi:triphosphoribosyl-dephospho-CoA synthase
VRASPAGLGRVAQHDVSGAATITLKQAMAEASDRDRIARQYVGDFADVFELGEPALTGMLSQAGDPRWATLVVYLAFLSAFPDSHIVRKHGIAIAEEIRQTASTFAKKFASLTRPDEMLTELLAWDAALKERGINPGTSADLTVATLFAHRLLNILPPHSNSD